MFKTKRTLNFWETERLVNKNCPLHRAKRSNNSLDWNKYKKVFDAVKNETNESLWRHVDYVCCTGQQEAFVGQRTHPKVMGYMTTSSDRASPSPVLTGMIEQVPMERIQTAEDARIQGVPNRRRKWTKEDNRMVMDCYLRNKSDVRRYRKRMLSLWRRKERFHIGEQRLTDQIKLVQQNQWLTTVEIEEMKRKRMENDHVERKLCRE